MKSVGVCLTLVAWIGFEALSYAQSGQAIRYASAKGKITLEGTSNIDNWQVESRSLAGFFEADNDFQTQPGRTPVPGPVVARAEVTIDARGLRSVEKDGKPFSNKMDEIMYDALKAGAHPKITFHLERLFLRGFSKANSSSSEFDVRGQLTVAGVSREISIPVKINALSRSQLRITGATVLKMTDFQIDPPAPKIALGLIKTADEIKVSFDWLVARQ